VQTSEVSETSEVCTAVLRHFRIRHQDTRALG